MKDSSVKRLSFFILLIFGNSKYFMYICDMAISENKFNGEISYIEAVLYSQEFATLSPKEQTERVKEVLKLKLAEVFQNGVRVGEYNIKSQLEKINYTKSE